MSFTHSQIISDGMEIVSTDFHSAMLNTLMLGMFGLFLLYSIYKLTYSVLYSIGMYTTIYVGAMYIYSATVLSSYYRSFLTKNTDE